MMNKTTSFLLPIIGFSIFVGIWFFIDRLHLIHPLFIASPEVVFVRMIVLIYSGEIVDDMLVTLFRTFAGYTIAALIGIPAGLALGYSVIARGVLTMPFEAARATPAAALFPLFLLLGGVSDASRIMMIIWGCTWIMLIQALYGVQNVNNARRLYLRSLGATDLQIFTKITFKDALPYISLGGRLSINIALILSVFSEMIGFGTDIGLGYFIFNSHLGFHTADMYSAILITALLGYFLNIAFVQFERRIVHWAGK